MNPEEAHVFFVDDEPTVRMAAERALGSSGMQVNVLSSAEDCLTMLSGQTCDVVITDVRMEGMDGISLLHTIRRRFPWLPIIITTGYGDIPLAVAAMKAGAADFLEKPLDREQQLLAIRKALEVSKRPEPPLCEGLSDLETQVLRLVCDGRTSKEIADALHRSVRTVEGHRHHVMQKFAARNIAQLVQRANELGLARPSAESADVDPAAPDEH